MNNPEQSKPRQSSPGQSNPGQAGTTLIEVVITLFILSTGLLSMAGLQIMTVKHNLDTAKHSQVTWIVNELVERMRANTDGSHSAYTHIGNAVLACTSTPGKRCADHTEGVARACNAVEMAAFDTWDVFCGQGETGDTTAMVNAQDSLKLSSVSITCNDATCDPDSDYIITVSWTSQAITNSQLLEQQGTNNTHKNQSIRMRLRL